MRREMMQERRIAADELVMLVGDPLDTDAWRKFLFDRIIDLDAKIQAKIARDPDRYRWGYIA